MNRKVTIITLGCPKNTVDSENMSYLLESGGYEVVADYENPDIILINTCSFINDAKTQSIETILEAEAFKKEHPEVKIVVSGCLSQRYVDELMEEIPSVDAFVGTGRFYDICDILDGLYQNEPTAKKYCDMIDRNIIECSRNLSTPYYYAYLKLAEGCDKHCTYCIIPSIRGKQRSRKIEDIVEEAQQLALEGVKEFILIAQDVGEYGTDIYQKRMLAPLLKELCKIDSLQWIRLLYIYPETITEDLIDTLKQEKKILHYIDIPFQHIDDTILKAMGRHTSEQNIRDLIARLRSELPDIIIRSSFITGFPGETQDQHNKLLAFLQEAHLQRVGIFPYSQEEGTAAAKLPDQLTEEIKLQRYEELMAQQEHISEKQMERFLEQTITVLIEAKEDTGVYTGRSYADAPEIDGVVYVYTDEPLTIGDFYSVLINDTMEYDLIGKLVQ